VDLPSEAPAVVLVVIGPDAVALGAVSRVAALINDNGYGEAHVAVPTTAQLNEWANE